MKPFSSSFFYWMHFVLWATALFTFFLPLYVSVIVPWRDAWDVAYSFWDLRQLLPWLATFTPVYALAWYFWWFQSKRMARSE